MKLFWNCLLLTILPLITGDKISMKETFKEVRHALKTNENVPTLPKAIFDMFNQKNKTERNADVCELCKFSVNELISLKDRDDIRKTTKTFLVNLCLIIGEYDMFFCDGYIEEKLDTLIYIAKHTPNLTGDRVCGLYLQRFGCVDDFYQQWHVNIPSNQTNRNKQISKGEKHAIIVQLSDLHYDPFYKAGSSNECKQVLCCQNITGVPINPANAAGIWGHMGYCDVPRESLLNLLSHVKEQHKHIDFIFLTGDTMSHWTHAGANNDVNVDELRIVYDEMKKTFDNIPVYPILGNHDANPSDYYAPLEVSDKKVNSQWLFDFIAEEWTSKWLPTECAETIRKGGYYTALAKPGLRIIALNNNVCYTSNVWLMYNDIDPYNQLEWLVNQLLHAEASGEWVYILAHIPQSDSCVREWAHEYSLIIERFAHVVLAEFNGHTHIDELKLMYNKTEPEKIIHVAYNGGSFSPFTDYNPNYKVYTTDANTHAVLDFETWSFNLTAANERKQIDWLKAYSFKDTYGLRDLSLEEFHNFHNKLLDNDLELLRTYYRHSLRNTKIVDKCDRDCLTTSYCLITSVDLDESLQCELAPKLPSSCTILSNYWVLTTLTSLLLLFKI